ncbi:MAG: alpha/beta fold hydrolase [Syntrophales bacterium]|nr:alpha/beta fold hydrolase [Syntrophales bacterium]
MEEDHFLPSLLLRNPHVQTILASSHWRARGSVSFQKASVQRIIDTSQGARLLGYYTPPISSHRAHGLVLLLHGWEGSVNSAYMLSLGNYLSQNGFEVFRLNFRDHGESHHLNQGLFHGALIEEVEEAITKVAEEQEGKPFFLVGFSLGGNFALRIAMRYTEMGNRIPRLTHVFAISPPLDPLKSTLRLDAGPAIYRHYFMKKWKRSLRKKQKLFPHIYDFRPLLNHKNCLALTEAIMPYFPEFSNYEEYFRLYTLTHDQFLKISIPTTVIVAEDDPVVTIDDFDHVPQLSHLTLYRFRYGGHCGFFRDFSLTSWYEEKIVDTIKQSGNNAP